MTYQILVDGKTLYYPGDEEYTVINPEITLKMNQAGTAKFTVPITNPLYDSIENRKSMITVKKNGREVFYGEARIRTSGMSRAKEITAAGVLSFLNDSIQPQHRYGYIPIYTFLNSILAIHNQQMLEDNRKIIRMGYVTVADDPDKMTLMVTDRETTLEVIRKNLLDVYGGVLRIRHQSGNLYLDYIPLSAYGDFCDQTIAIGENIMDIIEDYNSEDIKTVVIPLGAKIDDKESEFEKRVDIKTVNNDKDYIVNTAAKNEYGAIWTTVTFDGIDNPQDLYDAGYDYLYRQQFERATFKITAVDLSAIDVDMSSFYFGDRVQIQSFVVSGVYYIVEMTMKPLAPEAERIILSGNIKTRKTTLTGAMASTGAAMQNTAYREALKIRSVIEGEIANIIASFTGTSGGYKIEEFDENNRWLRTLYMDTNNVQTATNIMEFSMRGIRFSTGGYAPADSNAWKLAITIDGKIASQEIFSNIIFANLLKAGIIEDVAGNTSWNLETGSFQTKALQLISQYLTISNGGVITSRSAPNSQNVSEESLEIDRALIKGKRWGTDVGYIDLSADTDSDDGARYDAVIGSHGVLRLEFVNEIDFVDVSNPNSPLLVGIIDGNGWHGDIDPDSVLPAVEQYNQNHQNNSGNNNNNSNP